MLLALAALAEGREVLVSRGELIEIGDGFRIPDVLARSGARLVEVGTTNRTRAADYERAVGPETALLLRVHQSNFRVVGFTERPSTGPSRTWPGEPSSRSWTTLAPALSGSNLCYSATSPRPARASPAGADLVCFSGDKLLGGPQAGIVVGRAELVERLRRHPLQRALRADKLTLAALEGTLTLYLDPERARREIPVLRMLDEPADAVRARAERLAAAVGGEVEETVARVGGGALPLAELPSFACAVEEELAPPLRLGEPPRSGVVRDGRTAARLPHARRRGGRRGRRRGRWPRAHERARPRDAALGSPARRARHARAGDRRRPRDRRPARRRPAPVAELARETGADPDTLHRLLRALASDGVFAEDEPGVFRNTAAPSLLSGEGWSDFAQLFGGVWHRAVAELDATGEPPFPRIFGTDFWPWLADHPDERAAFDRAMPQGASGASSDSPRSTGAATRRVVDVGGGNGSLLAALLKPASWPARHRVRPPGDGPRRGGARTSASSSWKATSSSGCRAGDVYIVSTILHDWDDERATAILRTIRAAARRRRAPARPRDGATPGNEPDGAKWLDLLMLTLVGGRERNEAQWRALLAAGGFEPVSDRGRPDRGAMSLTVGTAGHIDHGKTSLVRALTGKDTDRLPEEQARGISIELGYAPLDLPDGRRLSLVDVPGHERFVRTMVPARPASTSSCW